MWFWRERSGNSMEKAVFPGGSTAPKQQIVCSRSFGERVTTYEAMRQAVCQHAERAAEKLRGERQFCRHIAVFVKTSPFAVTEPYYGNLASEKLLIPTQDTRDIIAAAVRALDRIWVDGHRYAKAGCMLNDFTQTGVSQLNLFDEVQPRERSEQLMQVWMGLTIRAREKYGSPVGDCPRVADEKGTTFASLYDTLGRYSCSEIDLKLWRFHLEILNINYLITIS